MKTALLCTATCVVGFGAGYALDAARRYVHESRLMVLAMLGALESYIPADYE